MARRPSLLFPVDVTIEPKGTSEHDDRAREPIAFVQRVSSVTVKAQVQWTSYNRGDPDPIGIIERSAGYLVLDVLELERKSYTPVRGDKIAQMPGATGPFYLHAFEPSGYLNGVNYLLIAHFRDRRPTRTA